jgi:hypothetical protein
MRRRRPLFSAPGLVIAFALILYSSWKLSEKRAQRKREVLYTATVRSYSGVFRAGMKRKEVEDYFRTNNIPFSQMCCVEQNTKWVLDDLTNIGKEKTPWFCSENNIYVAFQFVGSERHTPGPTAEDSDTLTKVTLFPWLEGCL